MLRTRLAVVLCCLSLLSISSLAAEPWTTYRGDSGRSANPGGRAGPASPKVLWVLKSQDHFIASPVPVGKQLFVSTLGGFNQANFSCLATDPKAAQRTLWSKTAPYLKLPTVSSPAIAGGKLIFGDGMHQTDGAILHCLRLEGGLPLWQLPLPGTLVHLEGSPTVANGRAYIGGGAAGVLCVHLDRVTLDGKEQDLGAIQKILDDKWKSLQAKYQEEKKKDEFAVPPSEDQLPKPTPVVAWQQGKERWHVDAPVAVVEDRVLVASAYLDKEKLGERSLSCLDARTGDIKWQAPLKLNPWGGPTVAGNTVVVGGSTIGYDPKVLKHGKGEVTAFDLVDGKVKWRKEVPGGVVSCVAVAGTSAVCTATDGKVRAFDLASGERRWIYDAKNPFFAPPATSADAVYAGDLNGVVHAIDLKTGNGRWTLDLGSAPEVKAPGMIYGGPVLHEGRLYVATCNLEGPFVRQPTAVVCIGE